MLNVDEVINAIVALAEGLIRDKLRFFEIIYSAGISPAIGCKNQSCDEVKLTVGGGIFRIADSGFRTAPGKISFKVIVMMLKVFRTPSPEFVENRSAIKLHRSHKTIRHRVASDIVVVEVNNISHIGVDFEINFARPGEEIIETGSQTSGHFGIGVAKFDKEVPVFACVKTT
jgi:hypothetical protein